MVKLTEVVSEADDAIPHNGIRLTEAYETVLAAADAQPAIQIAYRMMTLARSPEIEVVRTRALNARPFGLRRTD